jgi:Plant transposon protein
LRRILAINAGRGFPGMVGSIDCMHWKWKRCPLAWAGRFKGKDKKPTVALEAIADAELWIWHVFFGAAGSMNDVNVLDHSPTIEKVIAGKFPPKMKYLLNGSEYDLPYYCADGIYPQWGNFVHTIPYPTDVKETMLAKQQEYMRKDIEREPLACSFNVPKYCNSPAAFTTEKILRK